VAESIKGINIVIGTDVTALSKALGEVNKKASGIQTELKQVEKLLKMDPGNAQLMVQKQKLLADAVENAKKKLDGLRKAQEQVNAQFKKGEISEGQYRAFQREIIKTEGELKKLEAQGEKTNKTLSKDDAVKNLKNIGKAAGAAALAVGAIFVSMAGKAIENADELQKLSDVTGLSAERLQELQYAGANLGVDIETITGAQAKLTKAMFAAKDGTGSQADAFAALGVSVVDANGSLRDAKDVMGEAFTALNGYGNETERDALAMQLFGKSAMQLNPLIKAGGEGLKKLTDEARANGAVMSNEAVAGLDAFGDTIDSLKISALGSFGEMFAGMLPYLQGFLETIKGMPQWIQENSTLLGVIGIGVGTLTTALIAYNISAIAAAASSGILAAAAGALGAVIAFVTSPITLVILAIGALIAIGYVLIKNHEEIKAKISAVWENLKNWLSETWDSIKAKVVDVWNGIKEFIGNALGSIIDLFMKYHPIGILISQWDEIRNFFAGIASEAVSWGSNVIQGFVDGIYNMIGSIGDALGSTAETIRNFLGFHSPTKLGPGSDADQWAPNLIKMFTGGLKSGMPELRGAMNDLAGMLEVKPIDISGRLSVGGAIGVNITGEGAQYLKVDSIARAVEKTIVENMAQDSRRYAPIPRTIPFANS